MAWERRYIVKQLGLNSDSQTFSQLVPLFGQLSGFLVKLAYTNGATGGGGQDIADIVTKVEVIGNGNRILFSLSGYELLKWAYIWGNPNGAHRAPQIRDARAGNVQYCVFPICFGRYLGDDDYWINAQDYQLLQLNITYAPTISATQFATLTGVLDIIGVYWPAGVQPPARKGWLRTAQILKLTGAASGDFVQILAQNFRMAGALVYAFQAGIAEGVPVLNLELRINNATYIPITGRWVDLQEENDFQLNINDDEEMITLLADNATFETRSGRILTVDGTLLFADVAAENAVPLQRVRSIAGSQVTTAGILAAGAALQGGLDATIRPVLWRSRGIGIGHAVFLPFSRDELFNQVLETPSYADVRLAITQANAGSDIRLSTWEIVPTGTV